MTTEEKYKDVFKDYNYFGTDMATWKTNKDGFTIIDSGFIYGIEDHQYNPDEGDITKSRAIAILSWA